MTEPVQVRGQVLTARRAGEYHVLRVSARGMSVSFRAGQFVTVSVGGERSSMLCRRAFSILDVVSSGPQGDVVEFVFDVHGPGTAWLAERRPGDVLDLVGPLGRPFSLPRDPATCVLVGGGYGSAPLFPLAEALRGRGSRADFLLGGASAERIFGAQTAARVGATATFTTEDGSLGETGIVTDVLPRIINETGSEVVYACGPMAMLRAVSAVATEHGLPSQVAVEEDMACGIGVCMTCVLPIRGDDGVTRMERSCVEGPVFRGNRVRFDDIGSIPPDTLGAGQLAGAP